MGRCSWGFYNRDARIFHKKSNTTCTHSRTCSGATQISNKRGILRLTRNLSQHNDYYIEGNKIRRDLSIETDMCILRRYYKKKRNKMSTKDESNRSKVSTVLTELDNINESGLGACGDSRTTTKDTPQIDIAALMVENLKGLVTNWIQKHLLDDKDTKDKVETVLYSILHSEKEKVCGISSRSTYVLNKDGHDHEVKNKKVETTPLTCNRCNFKSKPVIINSSKSTQRDLSSRSVPSPVNFRVLSTLSIPRHINLMKIKSLYRINKLYNNRKHSVHKSKKILNSSSFDLLAISTRSFTKRCANYGIKGSKKHRKDFQPKVNYKKISNSTETEEKDERQINTMFKKELDYMPSLMKSIYAEHPANLSHANVNYTSDTFTLTDNLKLKKNFDQNMTKVDKYTGDSFDNKLNDKGQSEPMLTIDFLNHSVEFPDDIKKENTARRHDNDINVNNLRRNNIYHTKRKRFLKFSQRRDIRNKKYTLCHYRNGNQRNNKEILKHFQNILDYIIDDSCKRKFKLDIHLSVLPGKEKYLDASTCQSRLPLGEKRKDKNTSAPSLKTEVMRNQSSTLERNISSRIFSGGPEYNPGIVALLDGAASQVKYIFNIDNTIKSEPIKMHVTEDRGRTATSEIVREIHDLKSVVKDLLHKAEILMREEIKNENKIKKLNQHKADMLKVRNTGNLQRPIKPTSQGIQISNDFAKNLLFAGIRLSKEPKRDTFEFCNRLMRKSTSYKIIDSESVLRVTDMTVAETTEPNRQENILTNSLPKSKSLIEITTEKNEVLAYYYDDDDLGTETPGGEKKHLFMPKFMKQKKDMQNTEMSCMCSNFHSHQPIMNDCDDCSQSPSSTFGDVEECCYKKIPIPTRRGMGFGEGFIYCLLLWIPVAIIGCLFYSYIIKDLLQTPINNKLREVRSSGRSTNKTVLYLKLSDLGF